MRKLGLDNWILSSSMLFCFNSYSKEIEALVTVLLLCKTWSQSSGTKGFTLASSSRGVESIAVEKHNGKLDDTPSTHREQNIEQD